MGSGVGGSGRGGGGASAAPSAIFDTRREAASAYPVGTTITVTRRDGTIDTYRVATIQQNGRNFLPLVQRTNGNSFQRASNNRPSLQSVLIGAQLGRDRVRIN